MFSYYISIITESLSKDEKKLLVKVFNKIIETINKATDDEQRIETNEDKIKRSK